MAKFYIQTGENGKITDVLGYPYGNYVEAMVAEPLPVGILGGAYELRAGQILYRPEWDINPEISRLKEVTDQLLLAQLQGGTV